MRQNLDRLWDEIYPGSRPGPSVDPANIKKRVHATLNGVPSERRRYMRQKLRIAVICAAVLAALAGTALAAYQHYTALQFFNGDTTLIEPSVQPVDEVLENESYRIRVDSILYDSNNTFLGLSIEALTDEARAEMHDNPSFLTRVVCFARETANTAMIGYTFAGSPSQDDGSGRNVSVHLSGVGAPNTLRLYLAGSSPEDGIALPLDKPLESLSVQSDVSLNDSESVIHSCTLNAIGVTLEVQFAQPVKGDRIIEFCFRMADGSLKTLSQLNGTSTWLNTSLIISAAGTDNLYRYYATFRTPIDAQSVTGVLINGMEYSFLDPESAVPAEIPATMRPFLTPYLNRDDVSYFYAADVCGHIGAALERDGQSFTIRYLEKELTLSPGDPDAVLNEEPLSLDFPAILEGDELVLSREIFEVLGLCGSMYYPQMGDPVHDPDCWLVTP